MIALVLTALLSSAPASAPGARPFGPATDAAFDRYGTSMSLGKVGEWVTYRIKSPRATNYLRIAVVGEEKDKKGRPAVWVEIDAGGHHAMEAPMMQLRFLQARGQPLDREGVTRMFVAIGTGKPQEVEPSRLPEMLGERQKPMVQGSYSPELKVSASAAARLMTLAGTIEARKTEIRVGQVLLHQIWVSDRVPLMKLAKLDMPAIRHAMEVRDFGIDARPRMVLPSADEPKLNIEPGGEFPDEEEEEGEEP